MRWRIGAVFVAVCASAGTAPAAAQRPVRSDQTVEVQYNPTAAPVTAAFELPPARLWPLALLAYTRAGLRVDKSDPAHRRVDTHRQALWSSLKGHPLSDYFDCGSTVTGPIADRWRLTLEGQMAVLPRPAADSSGVALFFVANATATDGSASSGTPCVSRGTLEQAIAEEVRRLAPAPVATD